MSTRELSLSEFQSLADHGPLMVWRANLASQFTYLSAGWEGFAGRPLSEQLSKDWVQDIHSDDMERCLGTYLDAFQKRLEFQMEYRRRIGSGEYVVVMDFGRPEIDEQGNLVGYFGTSLEMGSRADETPVKPKARMLTGLLPICACCKNIRDETGSWSRIEDYICSHSEAEFTHGVCPNCIQKHYPRIWSMMAAESGPKA